MAYPLDLKGVVVGEDDNCKKTQLSATSVLCDLYSPTGLIFIPNKNHLNN